MTVVLMFGFTRENASPCAIYLAISEPGVPEAISGVNNDSLLFLKITTQGKHFYFFET